MKALDKEVHAWTLNDEKRIVNAAKLGVDDIITDDVYEVKSSLWEIGYAPSGHSINLETGEKEIFTIGNEYTNYINWFNDPVKYIIRYVKI